MTKSNTAMPIQLVMGLRNPGDRYAATRHNVGEWWLARVVAAYGLCYQTHKSWPIEVAKSPQVRCVRATTYMNHSGEGLGQYCRYFQIPAAAVLVAYDDLDLPVGKIKLKFSGGDGGHNGLKSVICHLQTKDFWRLRIGIGRPTGDQTSVSDYVLSKPSSADRGLIETAIGETEPHFSYLLAGDFEGWMRQVHASVPSSGSTS